MKIAFGCDRNGLYYKTKLIEYAKTKGLDICDVGTYEYVPCDSPYYAVLVGREVASGRCKYGVLICATGTGMVIAANKVKGVMCGMGYDDEVTKLMREHNNANVIAFGQKHMEYEEVERIFDIFVETEFSGLKHQAARVQQVKDIEEGKVIQLTPILNPDWK